MENNKNKKNRSNRRSKNKRIDSISFFTPNLNEIESFRELQEAIATFVKAQRKINNLKAKAFITFKDKSTEEIELFDVCQNFPELIFECCDSLKELFVKGGE
jgi:hypothetical protein